MRAEAGLVAVWPRLAAVRRALAWAERSGTERFYGAACAALIDGLLAGGEVDGPDAERLRDAAARLRGPDPVDGAAVRAAAALVESVVPLAGAGVVLPPLEPRGALVLPERLRRRRGRGREAAAGEAPEGEAASPEAGAGEAAAPEDAASEAPAEAPPAAGAEAGKEPSPAAEPAAPAEDAGEAAPAGAPPAEASPEPAEAPADAGEAPAAPEPASAPEPEPDKEPPPPARLPLDHPDTGGRPLDALVSLDDAIREALAAAGVRTVADLVRLPPREHLRHRLVPLAALGEVDDGEVVAVRGRVAARCSRFGPAGVRRELTLCDGDGACLRVRWPGEPPLGWAGWNRGETVGFVGRLIPDEEGGVPSLLDAEPVGLAGRGSGALPRYGVEGVPDRLLRDLVRRALLDLAGRVDDPLPGHVRRDHRLLGLEQALIDAHFPANPSARGRVRLAFEELLLIQLGIAWRSGRAAAPRGIEHQVAHAGLGQLQVQHDFVLNDRQELVFSEIRRDLHRATPMVRLLQGDVGAGKGRVALATAVVVASGGSQVAIVAPDALAAERMHLYAEPLLKSLGLGPMLVPGQPRHAELDAIRRGEVQVVVGTARLLDRAVAWRKLGLVIVEERGPYGTVRPAELHAARKPAPDLLVHTRAPIPASLAFTVFGEFDVSVLERERPPRVRAAIVAAEEREQAYLALREAIARGRQAYVVLPVDLDTGRDREVEIARTVASVLKSSHLPDADIAIYCSAMPRDLRQRVFDDFEHRRIDVLVTTTLIEDAPTLAEATAMVVEAAETCDVTRLHRLRGHVGFGIERGQVHFVLSEKATPADRERLERVVRVTDGFELAEMDLAERGPAALLGDRAADAPRFTWADPARDRLLLLRARGAAFQLVADDPEFRRNADLGRAVNARWGAWLGEAVSPPKPSRKRRGRRRRRRR